MADIDGTNGNDFLTGTPFNDQMNGNDGFDTMLGNEGIDLINGNRDGDRLLGGRASDVMYGGKGNDNLFGGKDNDSLFGDLGNDTLQGENGTDTLTGGSGADLFIITGDVVTDFSSAQGDQFLTQNSLFSSNLSTSTVSEESNTPFFLELKQQGNDLLIGDSRSERYTTLVGLGEAINDPLPLVSSINFSKDPLLGYSEEISEPETDSQDDVLAAMRGFEADLIQLIDHVENGGLASELGVQGPGADMMTIEQYQEELSQIQGFISDKLAEQEEAAIADNFLLPEVLEPGKQVFVVEEGTSIPLDIQQEMAGSEVLFMPSEFFEVTTLDPALMSSTGLSEPEGLF
ncbi:MAG: calcium-binding protein [Okeania sp. SIO3C4]|nr:calcium-binding protein [Okeania sp. SIO3C4]